MKVRVSLFVLSATAATLLAPVIHAQEQIEFSAAVVTKFVGSTGLRYDECARRGFLEPMLPNAEARFELSLASMMAASEEPFPPEVPEAMRKIDRKAMARAMQKAWQTVKQHRNELVSSNISKEDCGEVARQMDKFKPHFPVK